MPQKRYTVELSADEREKLEAFVSKGSHSARAITRARILLKSDDGATDREIAAALDCSENTPYHVRKRYAERGLDAIRRKKSDRNYERKLDEEDEAQLLALAKDTPPDGQRRWTLRLLADAAAEHEQIAVDSISHQTVRDVLKKHDYELSERRTS